ncbi:tRNA lysidine(34) synthetase TilS [Salidesulfovibrio onnuriiensis]|uniref:tRNA lysidine(34) synthetase TilS n=1 Tax=Salidesulfovibrio onnuriiensis TaxID=2583823 RepID=UPI00164F10DB|nr:tRNA lysidine(34) synthetase TilS [Salidesulfovibrio onnuriiensis]
MLPPATLQDLPPKWAHFCLGIEKFLNRELGLDLAGKTVLAAFSGGIDSTALLLVFKYLCLKNNGTLVAAHLDHGLRKESRADADHARALCKALGVDCVVEAADVASLASERGVGVEEAGREARYAFFARVMAKRKADCLAVGHHLDDLCEDVLMRLTRGVGWPALSGMEGHDPRRSLVRPFLLTPKARLRAFLEALRVQWREDASNEDLSYKRNRVRHSILPLFLEENPNFPETVARMWKMGRMDADYWDRSVSASDTGSELLSKTLLDESHSSLRLRMYKRRLDALGPGQVLADSLLKLDFAWVEKRLGAVFQFPGEKIAKVTVNGVLFGFKR